MTGTADEEVQLSPVDWVAQQARTYEESGGTEGTTLQGAPCLLLDYQGWRTGRWHRTVLIYGEDHDAYLIVASKGGADDHPQWYRSIVANPDVRLRIGPDRFPARARTLSNADKTRVWGQLMELWPPYADYQARTTRDIPVVRLEEIPGS